LCDAAYFREWENMMLDVKFPQAPTTDDSTATAFADIPHVPVASALSRPTNRRQSRIVFGCVAAGVVGLLVIYLTRPTNHVDPNAPRVVAEVTGMHCPIQCGLRVAASLIRLPFVQPGSVTANPKTGVVTFAVTEAGVVDGEQVRRAI